VLEFLLRVRTAGQARLPID